MDQATAIHYTAELVMTGDLRSFLAKIAVGVMNDQIATRNAVIAVKACEQINASLYSEAKIAALTLAAGNRPPALGNLSIRGDGIDVAAMTKAA